MSDGLRIFGTPEESGAAFEDAVVPEAGPKVRPRWPGVVSVAIAMLMVISWTVALALVDSGTFEIGVGLGISSFLLSGIAVILGLVAVLGRWGRGWGAVGAIVAVVLNPLVVLLVLSWWGML